MLLFILQTVQKFGEAAEDTLRIHSKESLSMMTLVSPSLHAAWMPKLIAEALATAKEQHFYSIVWFMLWWSGVLQFHATNQMVKWGQWLL